MDDKKDTRLSIMVIPKTRKVRKVTIPNWLPKSILIGIVVVSVFFIFTFGRKANVNSSLEQENLDQEAQISELENRIQELKATNESKNSTITELNQRNAELNSKAKDVEIKLEQIGKLKKELENMANK